MELTLLRALPRSLHTPTHTQQQRLEHRAFRYACTGDTAQQRQSDTQHSNAGASLQPTRHTPAYPSGLRRLEARAWARFQQLLPGPVPAGCRQQQRAARRWCLVLLLLLLHLLARRWTLQQAQTAPTSCFWFVVLSWRSNASGLRPASSRTPPSQAHSATHSKIHVLRSFLRIVVAARLNPIRSQIYERSQQLNTRLLPYRAQLPLTFHIFACLTHRLPCCCSGLHA